MLNNDLQLIKESLEFFIENHKKSGMGICSQLTDKLGDRIGGHDCKGYDIVRMNCFGWIQKQEDLTYVTSYEYPKAKCNDVTCESPIPNYDLTKNYWEGDQLAYRISLIKYLLDLIDSGKLLYTEEEYQKFSEAYNKEKAIVGES